MTLMIKPTTRCQFRCDFCSAGKLDRGPDDNELIKCISEICPDDLIVTGGDPLMKTVEFYDKILEINDKMKISLTTNLWDFHVNRLKWKKLFKNERVGVCTSFQYGTKRRKPDNTPYTEEDFLMIIDEFSEDIGYVPPFISVISEENEKYTYDHVLLAKKIGTVCKLNGMYPIGLSIENYPRYKMLKHYINVYDMGLQDYEEHTKNRHIGICPFNTCNKCEKLNRSLDIQNGSIKYSYCEDMIFQTNDCDNTLVTDNIDDVENIIDNIALPEDCLCCRMMNICNSCSFHRYLLHKKHIKNDKYCIEMNNLYNDLKRIGFKI